MGLFGRVRYSEVQWPMVLFALLLTAFGIAFVASATTDPEISGWAREARMQTIWFCLALVAFTVCLHVPLETWRNLAIPAFVIAILLQLFMLSMRGTALVPTIKGAHNWLAFGSLRVQPSEFYKLAALLMAARLLARPQCDIRTWSTSLQVLALAGLPAVLIAREDLGSALTFGPLLIGILIFAGMPLRQLLTYCGAGLLLVGIGVASLHPASYQYKRIQAWLDPESHALTEGYQTIRALRSIGSGQWTGKGYSMGDQNLLGWLPEEHTDMIFSVVAEELGFLGASLVPLLFAGFALAGFYAAARCRDVFGRLVIAGFTCLIFGQATINLCVVMGLMPVTGITLPFMSYGGSSLLASFAGLGICAAASAARRRQLGRDTLM